MTPKTTTPVVVTTPVIVTSQNIFSQQEVMSIASEDEMQDDGNDDGWKRTVGEEESGGDGRGECQGGGDSDEDRSMKGIDDNEDESGDELEPGYIGYTGAKGKKSRDGGDGGGCRSGGGGGENGEDGETDEDEPYLGPGYIGDNRKLKNAENMKIWRMMIMSIVMMGLRMIVTV